MPGIVKNYTAKIQALSGHRTCFPQVYILYVMYIILLDINYSSSRDGYDQVRSNNSWLNK
jgi:hypothetical protein